MNEITPHQCAVHFVRDRNAASRLVSRYMGCAIPELAWQTRRRAVHDDKRLTVLSGGYAVQRLFENRSELTGKSGRTRMTLVGSETVAHILIERRKR